MATQSSILAWEIPWTEELCGLQFMGLQRVKHDFLTQQQQQNIYMYIFFFKRVILLFKALVKNVFHAFQFRMHSMTRSRMTPISTSAVT